jgi:predicted ATPase
VGHQDLAVRLHGQRREAAATRAGVSARVDLAPLTQWEVDELLGTAAFRGSREALYRESGGIPFYIEQLLRVRPAAGAHDDTAVTSVGLPDAVTAALEEELASLPSSVRSVLDAAAVAGDPFDADLAAAVAGIEATEVWRALDVLTGRDVVRTTSVPVRFRFRHPIIRRAAYDAMRPSARTASHALAVTVMARTRIRPRRLRPSRRALGPHG